MGLVFLHHAGYAKDTFQEKWEQGDVVFVRDEGVGGVELVDVVGTVVGREGDAGESDFGAAFFEGADDLVEVGAGGGDGQAAEAVVATELDDDDGGMEGEDVVETIDAVFGGVAADALVDDAVVVAEGVEVGLEIVGVALTGVGSVAGGEAVAEADDEGAVIGRRGLRCRGWLRCFLLRGGGSLCIVCAGRGICG